MTSTAVSSVSKRKATATTDVDLDGSDDADNDDGGDAIGADVPEDSSEIESAASDDDDEDAGGGAKGNDKPNENDVVLEDRAEDVEEILGAEFEEEPEGEELFGDGFGADYVARPELDVYDEADIDRGTYAPLTAEQRQAAEERIAARERLAARQRKATQGAGYGARGPAALLDDDGDDGDGDDGDLFGGGFRRRRRGAARRATRDGASTTASELDSTERAGGAGDSDGFEAGAGLDMDAAARFALEERQGPLREWVCQEEPRRELLSRFRQFLLSFPSDNPKKNVYKDRIRSMCAANGESLHVSFLDLSHEQPTLAVWLADAPNELLDAFDEALSHVVRQLFPHYESIKPDVHVRVTDLPLCDSLRDLRENQLGCLVKVAGVVTRRTSVFPQLRAVKFDCVKCRNVLGPFLVQPGGAEPRVSVCPRCHSGGPFPMNVEQTIYRNYQRATLQEAPGSVPPGRLPRTKELVLHGDLVDSARPGEAVEVTGVYRHAYNASLNSTTGFPVFSTLIEVNYVNKKEDLFSSFQITEDDVAEIRHLAADDRIADRLFKSIAPSIYGHEDIKVALALALFGGQPKNVRNKHRIRGDINVLLLGDPGLGKSQFLKFAEKTAQRGVFTTGQGASAVGLTAAVRMDALTREWTLEGGALVLADRGVCLIDEFDKMSDVDRTSIHEAMEQQSISISKAGIVTTLQARCAVIAAANPIKGRYDPSRSFAQNVELTEPILDRFDIMCVVRDIVDPVSDERLARFVVGSHRRSHPHRDADDVDAPDNASGAAPLDADIIPHELLRKYIVYAKRKSHPRIVNVDRDKIAALYADLRRASMNGGGVPMGVRYLESIIRMSEAHARMHLRDYVREDDVNLAIKVMLNSFITSQKFSVARTMHRHFRKYLNYRRDNNELLLFLLQEIVRQTAYYLEVRQGQPPRRVEIELADFEARAREMDISDLQPFFASEAFLASFELRRNALPNEPTLIVHELTA
jgi:DNA replication licensing factor MCM2